MSDPELDELKREFLAEAQEKVKEMAGALDGKRSPESVDRVIYLAHQLKGSGGSYGFQRISTEAADLEKTLEDQKQGAAIDDRAQKHVESLRSEVERALKSLR